MRAPEGGAGPSQVLDRVIGVGHVQGQDQCQGQCLTALVKKLPCPGLPFVAEPAGYARLVLLVRKPYPHPLDF